MEKGVSATAGRLPHKIWRKKWKKMRRKKLRQASARFRDSFSEQQEQERLKDDAYRSWLQEQEHLEKVRESEEETAMLGRHQVWLEREKQAKLDWERRKLKEEQQKQAREQQEKQIQEEWNAIKKAEEEEKRKRDEEDQQRKQRQEALLGDALSELEQNSAQNPPVPSADERTVDSRPGLPLCPFFEKTGCCRFGPRCSRNHRHVLLGRCLLLERFYQPLGVRFTLDDEQNLDVGLEFDDAERARHFTNFYEDVLPELRSCGEVVQFKVCQNYEPHLRGNVYVQYATENEAARAFKSLNGRWYGGEQISVRFVDVQRWSRAICGSFFRGNCPKGRNCNFLHVFINPNGEFWRADRDLPSSVETSRERSYSSRGAGGWGTERRSSRRHSEEEERRSRTSSRRDTAGRESSRSRRSPGERSSSRSRRSPGERSSSRSRRSPGERSSSRSRWSPGERSSSRSRRSPGERSSSRRLGRDSMEHESTRTEQRDNEARHKHRSQRYSRRSHEQEVSERGARRTSKSRRSRTPDDARSTNRERRARSRTPKRSRVSKRHRSRSKDRQPRNKKRRSSRTPDRHRSRSDEREHRSPKPNRWKEPDCDRELCGDRTEYITTSQAQHSPKCDANLSSNGASKCYHPTDSPKTTRVMSPTISQ